MNSWPPTSLPVQTPRAPAATRVTRPTAMTWLRRLDRRLASSGARTRNPPTMIPPASSSTRDTMAMTRYGSNQPRVAATIRVLAVTGLAASCTCAPPAWLARRSLHDPATHDKTELALG